MQRSTSLCARRNDLQSVQAVSPLVLFFTMFMCLVKSVAPTVAGVQRENSDNFASAGDSPTCLKSQRTIMLFCCPAMTHVICMCFVTRV